MTWAVWPSREWPRWVSQALPTNTLRQAWERKLQLTLSGDTFEYRMTPVCIAQGQWDVGQIERQPKRPSTRDSK